MNDADFLVVRPSFFTDKGSWRAEDGTHPPYSLNDSYVSQLQDLVLDGKFSNPNLFENLTGPECNTRYLSQTFITDVGVGFAVPNLTMLEGPYKPSGSLLESAASTGSLKYYVSGSTGLNGEFLSCKCPAVSSPLTLAYRALLQGAQSSWQWFSATF